LIKASSAASKSVVSANDCARSESVLTVSYRS